MVPVRRREERRQGARRNEAPAGTQRRCIASGELHPKEALIRFVVGPDRQLVPDLAGRLPGRGLWLLPSRDMLNRARRRNLFAKAARGAVVVPADLDTQVERLIVQRCLESLGLARRAGQAVAGFEKVRAWLREGRARLLLQALDGAEDGRRKLRALAAAVGSDGSVPVIELLTADELGRAFGEAHRVHAAVAPGALAARLAAELDRLAGFRPAAETIDTGRLRTAPDRG